MGSWLESRARQKGHQELSLDPCTAVQGRGLGGMLRLVGMENLLCALEVVTLQRASAVPQEATSHGEILPQQMGHPEDRS